MTALDPTLPLRGQSLRRFEDERFLTGRGRYIEDIDLPGQVWMHVVRSPHAHAAIKGIDAAEARAMPGVLGVFTAADLSALGPLPCMVSVASVAPMAAPPRHALAKDRARHVGDPVAFVIAESRDSARSAAETILVDYDPLPSVTDTAAALAPGAPQIWDQAPGNLSYRFQKGDAAAVQAAIASAAHVVELEIVNNRIVISALETRGAIATYEDAHGFHLQFSGAGVHALQSQLAETVFGVPADRMRVSCPDVGGGFGVKNALYPEWVMQLWAARHLGCPVKWIGDRAEDFVTTAQGRDNVTRARLALDAEGHFLALDVATIAGLGAYLSTGGPGSSTSAPVNAMGCGYVIPAIFMDVQGAFANAVPIDAYRGAGKPEVNYMIERLVDAAARQCDFDPIDLRHRNLVAQFPYRKALGTTIDCGRFASNLDEAVIAADHAGFPARRADSQARGKLRGVGVTCFMETARGAPNEGAELRFNDDDTVSLLVGTQSNGMGHETTYPQIAADLLGLPIETFRYVQADTEFVRAGNGHGGARSMHQGGAALCKAIDTMLAKARPIAARLLQAAPSQIAFIAGRFIVQDDPARGVALLDVARAARDPANVPDGVAPGLDTYVWNLLDLITYPNGCHIAEVEIDPDTGAVTLDRYTAVDDFGTLLNPMLTLGQVQGGVVQGIGQAMLEHTVYDPDTGQLLSGTFMDYTLPRALDLPPLDIRFIGVPTEANPLGVKGSGQAGAIASPQAIICAILDALAPRGVTHIDMPATSERIWRSLQGR
ncbi:MAG TPA: xanthine dehydrogenase family protein molybdopterin-binding subunit [Acetobacteraceae bacterium]|jgi:carbon-monoxide dehydrogenase large subunit|nr:xanthine dehydrogenase family protein molybdopterin-binding subunit [Acetobacteraceae bacterium]